MKMAKRKTCLLVAVGALVLLLGILGTLLWQGTFLAKWQEKAAIADVNADGIQDAILLQHRTLQIVDANGVQLWCAQPNWLVEDFLLGDIDGDGETELLLLAWRRGSFGEKRPFWVEKDEWQYSQHIFIYALKDGIHPIWMSSRLRPQVKAWAMEQDGTLAITTPAGENTRWGWVHWGLERMDGGTILV